MYFGIPDLRSAPLVSCWSDAAAPEAEVLFRLSARLLDAPFEELVSIYARSFSLPQSLIAAIEGYILGAEDREAWTVRYFDFCSVRYGARTLGGTRALEAGCGSGGAIPHLVSRFGHVVGVDPDRPSLLLCARRCADRGIAARVSLAAAMLEQHVLSDGAFDAIKCTDVIEHVHDVAIACQRMAKSLAPNGALFVLTPNRWSLTTPEPHVRLWGVQCLPIRIADWYVRRRIGIPYRHVANLLGYRRLGHVLRMTRVTVQFIPVEEKHLNPHSPRGQKVKRLFSLAPFAWLSLALRPLQPTLEALCISPPRAN